MMFESRIRFRIPIHFCLAVDHLLTRACRVPVFRNRLRVHTICHQCGDLFDFCSVHTPLLSIVDSMGASISYPRCISQRLGGLT